MMKRIQICLLCVLLLIGLTTGCANGSYEDEKDVDQATEDIDQATDALHDDSETEKQEDEPIISVWDGTIADGFSGGVGMEDDPYLICSAAELAYLAQLVNDGKTYQGQYYKLCCDVVMNSKETMSEEFRVDGISSEQFENYRNSDSELNLWTPIGTEEHPFRGNFDGDNHTISGMAVVGRDGGQRQDGSFVYRLQGHAGFFGYAENAFIMNLHFENAAVFDDTGARTGILLGTGRTKSNNPISIYNCSTDASCVVYNYHGDCGGICGYLSADEGSIYVNKCINNGSVISATHKSGSQECGGIAGTVCGDEDHGSNVQMAYCANTGLVSGYGFVGGIVGSAHDCTRLSECYNTGKIPDHSWNGYYLPGNIVGATSECMFINCYMTADNGIDAVGDDGRNNTIDVKVVPASYLEDSSWVEKNIGTFSVN